MPDGGTIKLVATRESENLVIGVSDTGIGVPDEAQENLFKPFYTTKPGGMGLGLASSRRMVAAQGGTISFVSKAGEGSTFSIILPLIEKNPV
jgi:signal transduction histidine kinase